MRFTNTTKYNTRDLRRLCMAGLAAAGADHRLYGVSCAPSQRHMRGRAACPGTWLRLMLPQPPQHMEALGLAKPLDVGVVARVLEHEIAHTLGVHHKDMDGAVKSCAVYADTAPVPAWAAGLTVRLRAWVPGPDKWARIKARRDHATKMAARWARKLKLAQRKAKVWAARVRQYARLYGKECMPQAAGQAEGGSDA